MTSPGGEHVDTAYVDILPDVSSFVRVLRRDLDRALRTLERTANDAFGNIEDSASDAGRTIAITITIGAQRAERAIDDLADSAGRDFKRISRSASDAGRDISSSFTSGVFGGVTSALQSLGSALLSFGSSSPLLLLLLALAPAVLAVSAALADLVGFVGLLPAGIAVALAAIIPLVVAFQNFGGALSAIAEGDPEKIAEALKKLAPAAASVAKEFQKLFPALKDLQRFAQQQLFLPLQGTLTNLANTLLPSVRQGVGQVAAAFGETFAVIAKSFTTPANVQLLNDLFAKTAEIVRGLGAPLSKLFTAFGDATKATLPIFGDLVKRIFDGVTAFADFLTEAAKTGELQSFIDDALKTFGELFDLVKSVGRLFGTLFGATDDSGRDFIGTLTDLTDRMNAFFKSAEGQDALQDVTELVKVTGQALGFLVDALLFTIDVFSDLDELVRGAKQDLTDFFVDVILGAQNLVDRIKAIPSNLKNFALELVASIKGAFQAAIDGALAAVGIGVGLIFAALIEGPRQFLSFLATYPDQVKLALAGFGVALVQVFDTAMTTAKDFLVTKFEEIKAFINGVPDAVAALGPRFLDAGLNLIKSFMNGFRSVGNFIGDVAGDIVGAIKGFLNKAIDKINVGITLVDDVLPGSLPRIPRLARGGIVPATPGGRNVNVAEAGEDEVIAPLSKLEKMLGGTGMVINFGAGSIPIVFEGVVPSQQEARQVGQSVVDGMIEALQRRDIRMMARAAG